jgi:hypothetical protein
MSRSGDVGNREIVHGGAKRGIRQPGSENTLGWYAGTFLMVNPNPDPPVAEPAQQFSNQLASRLDPQTPKGRANTAGMELLLQALARQEAAIREGGGPKAIDAQHSKKRLTARERLDLLLDPRSGFGAPGDDHRQ